MAYVVVVVRSRLAGMDESLEEAAMDLGGRPLAVFFDITVPMLLPALVSGWLLSFTLSLDDLVISSFVSGPGATTLPMLIFAKVRLGVTPDINAITTIIIALVAIARRDRPSICRSRRRPVCGMNERPGGNGRGRIVQELLEGYRDGDYALPGCRVRDPDDLRAGDPRASSCKSWLYVGHQSQIPERGDYFLFEIAGESVIVMRDARGRHQRAAERLPAPRLAHLRRGRPGTSRASPAATTAGPTASTARCAPRRTCRRASTARSWGCGACTRGSSTG